MDASKRRLTRRQLMVGGTLLAAAAVQSPLARAATTRKGPLPERAAIVRSGMRIYGDDAYPVWYRRAAPPGAPTSRYTGFKPGTTLLRKGTIRREGALPLPCDMIFERDVALEMRDGVRIYTDLFRPAAEGRFPALVNWSPYGKSIGSQWLDDIPGRHGVPLASVSEWQKWEAADPAYWVAQGYVVLNPDPRGSGMSEGDMVSWGRQTAEDGYDYIEWAAAQPWSSGKVAMVGNSWLAISQWFIAAEKPPHLTAIAPWEGASDLFSWRSGISNVGFTDLLLSVTPGNRLIEDQARMSISETLRTPYWADKKAALEKIDIPAYVVASWTNPLHTHGTLDGFRRIASKDKWLRVHNTHEWTDFYDPTKSAELLRFLDHYLKGRNNGWDDVPRIRVSVHDTTGADIVERVETEFPLSRAEATPLHLTGPGMLGDAPAPVAATLSYDVMHEKAVTLRYIFPEDAELHGYMKLRLWLEARGASDMDLAIKVVKADASGHVPAPGWDEVSAKALFRASHRALDVSRSTPSEPVLLHDKERLLARGEIVPVDIPVWPMALRFRKGEQLHLTVSAFSPGPLPPLAFGESRIRIASEPASYFPGEAEGVRFIELGGPLGPDHAWVGAQRIKDPPSRNKGTHVIHFGGKYDSHLLVPLIRNPA